MVAYQITSVAKVPLHLLNSLKIIGGVLHQNLGLHAADNLLRLNMFMVDFSHPPHATCVTKVASSLSFNYYASKIAILVTCGLFINLAVEILMTFMRISI